MQDCFVIVCNATKGQGRFWLGRNPLNNAGVWIFECFVKKPMRDWEPVIFKTREAAENILKKVKRTGAYIQHFQA